MMSLTFGLFTQVSDSGPHGPLVFCYVKCAPIQALVMDGGHYLSKAGGRACIQ